MCVNHFVFLTIADNGVQVLGRFLTTKARSSQIGAVDPLSFNPEKSDKTSTSRIVQYNAERDRMDSDTTSRLRFVTDEQPLMWTS